MLNERFIQNSYNSHINMEVTFQRSQLKSKYIDRDVFSSCRSSCCVSHFVHCECAESYGHSQTLQVSDCTVGQDQLLDFY